MEIWVEYLFRHGLPIVRPFAPFEEKQNPFDMYVPSSPPMEQQIWAFFLYYNRQIISNYSQELETAIREWNEATLLFPQENLPTFNEQQSILFEHLPLLQELWTIWQDATFISSATLRNPITGYRLLSVRDEIRP